MSEKEIRDYVEHCETPDAAVCILYLQELLRILDELRARRAVESSMVRNSSLCSLSPAEGGVGAVTRAGTPTRRTMLFPRGLRAVVGGIPRRPPLRIK